MNERVILLISMNTKLVKDNASNNYHGHYSNKFITANEILREDALPK